MSANVNFDSNTEMSNSPSPGEKLAAAAAASRVRPFYWSVRRELWENRSIYIAPAAVSLIVLVSALVGLLQVQGEAPFSSLLNVPPHEFRLATLGMYGAIAGVLAVTAGIVGWFYCLDSLSGERRDRSILFWRSLPVSDVTTVLSKVLIGMAVVPLIALIVGIVLYIILLLAGSIVLAVNGVDGTLLLGNAGLGELVLVHIIAATAAILWSAPMYAWAILVSSVARRATFLWALMPPAAIALAEGLAFGTTYFLAMISQRVNGVRHILIDSVQSADDRNFRFTPDQLPDSLLSLLDPVRFLSRPDLWLGLLVAAGFIAAAIWMRRYREPL